MNKYRTGLFILITGLSVSCMKEEAPAELDTLSLSYHKLDVSLVDITFESNNNLSKSIMVTAENTDWEISGLPEWLNAQPMSGSNNTNVTLTAKKNTSTSNIRTAKFEIRSHSSEFSRNIPVSVTQECFSKDFDINGVSFRMIGVEAGTFMMGGNDSEATDIEKPVYQVSLTSDYYISETEVTQALWQTVMGSLPSRVTSYYGKGKDYPIYCITYDQIQDFVEKISQRVGVKFRLPTEAEWEFAARGGNESKGYLYAGSNVADDVAWYGVNPFGSWNTNYGTHIVKKKQPNELGIYDMSGNVKEWCADGIEGEYFSGYSSEPVTDPKGSTTSSYYVVRGGDWGWDAKFCRVSYRNALGTESCSYDLGFRIAL